MITTAISLLATAVLTAILLGAVLGSNGSSAGVGNGDSISNAPGVAEATSLQAQQTLSTGLTTVETTAADGGGYGSLQPSTLSASTPSITFVEGPSTNATTLSMAVTAGPAGQQEGATGGEGGVSAAIAAAGAGAGAGGATSDAGGTGGSGSVTLADRSSGGICWLVWRSDGAATWYGAQSGQSRCTAPVLSSAPSPGPVSSSSIGWQEGSFPAP